MGTKAVIQSVDADRLAHLRMAYETGSNAADSHQYLSQATLNTIHELATTFDAAIQSVVQLTAQRASAVAAATERVRELAFLVQDARRTLRAGVRRCQIPAAVLRYYSMSQEGRLPQPHSRTDWLHLAETLLNGNSSAQAEGYAGGQRAEETVVQITSALLVARAHLQTQREAAKHKIRALKRELRYNLAEQPLPHQREIMRTYGVRFHTRESEPAEVPAPQPEIDEAELALV